MKYKLRGSFSTDPIDCMESVLSGRGVKDVDSFLNPSPEDELDYGNLDNIYEGVEMLLKHLNGRIAVVVDADVDGITSSCTMMLYIKKINPDADIHYFCHDGKKHGIEDIVREIEDDDPFDLMIVPDAGSNDIKYMEELKAMGTDVLILDHHECEFEGYDCIPDNTVLINVAQSEKYENKDLCGAGVVYKFCEALDERLDVNYAFDFIDLVSLGEIADGMGKNSLETNYIMNAGVRNIKNGALAGFLEAQAFKLKEKALPPYSELNTSDVAFYIAPLLNAIVRVGTKEENETLIDAFLHPDKMVPSTKRGSFGEMEKITEQVARLGVNCRARQNRIKDNAIDYIDFKIQDEGLYDDSIIIVRLNHEEVDFPNSLTGLIATNFVNKYGKPTLIGWDDPEVKTLKGSIRGSENFERLPDLKEYLMSSGYFDFVMGHSNAAGFGMPIRNIEDFTKFANENIPYNAFNSCYMVDYVFDIMDIDLYQVAYTFAAHPEYFGSGIPEVKFIIKNVPVKNPMIMGADKTSCKISCGGIDFVKFKDVDFINDITRTCEDKIDILCKFSLNYFNGSVYVQGMIEDYEFSAPSKYDF